MYSADHQAISERAVASSRFIVLGNGLLYAETDQWLVDWDVIHAFKIEVL